MRISPPQYSELGAPPTAGSGGIQRSGQVSVLECAEGQTGNRTGTQGSSGPLSPSPTPAQTTSKSKHISRAARAPEFYYLYPEPEADPSQQTQVCRIPA